MLYTKLHSQWGWPYTKSNLNRKRYSRWILPAGAVLRNQIVHAVEEAFGGTGGCAGDGGRGGEKAKTRLIGNALGLRPVIYSRESYTYLPTDSANRIDL